MANWCNFRVTVTGPKTTLLLIQVAVNEAMEPMQDDANDCAYDCNPAEDHWFWTRADQKMRTKDSGLLLDATAKWHAPMNWVQAMSQVYPDTVWTIAYAFEGLWDCAAYEFRNFAWKQLRRSVGYFHTAKGDEPVHHWMVWLPESSNDEAKEIRADCLAAGYAIDAHEVGCYCDLVTRDLDALTSYLNFKHNCGCYGLAQTLDEVTYLDSVEYKRYNDQPMPPQDKRTLLRACERDIQATPEEVDWLIANLARERIASLERSRSGHDHKTYDTLPESERDDCVDRLLRIKAGHGLMPFELGILIARATPERQAELRAAMPKWCGSWPDWDLYERERQRAATKPNVRVESPVDQLFADTDFYEDIHNLKPMKEVSPKESEENGEG